MEGIMEISVVIPIHNESENIFFLEAEIRKVLTSSGLTWECIWVDDASQDSSWQEIKKLKSPNRGVSLKNQSGQTTATMAGIDFSKYEYIVTLDGDGQNDPQDILSFITKIQENSETDLIQGFRRTRHEKSYLRKVFSKSANKLVQRLTGKGIIDLGCSIRLFRKDLIKDLRLTGEMHRLLALYLLDSGARIIQIPVNHRPRAYGKSKYGFDRVLKLAADVILYKALKSIFINPMYTFSKFALSGFMVSSIFALLAVTLRITGVKNYLDGNLITVSILLFSTSSLFVGLGLVGEMLSRVIFSSNPSYQYTVLKQHK
jgi:glycosyltransferase involved in cell wall biosynthesis